MNPTYKSADLAWNFMGDQAVILTLGKEKFVHELNPVGAEIWRLCDGLHDAEQIAMNISLHFDISAVQAKADTLEFLNDLKGKGLIDWE